MPRMSIRSIRYRRSKNPTWDLDLARKIVLKPDELPGTWDFHALFERNAPVEVEIGFGKGRFLLAAAERQPDRNWLGIEYVSACVSLVAERAARRELRSIRLVRAPAEEILADHVGDDAISSYHVYFPDPWPKKRHHKRRLIKPPFVADVLRTLKPGGSFHVATDYGDYFEEMLPIIAGAGFHRVETLEDREDEVFRTNFEVRFIEQGKPIYRARFVKPR